MNIVTRTLAAAAVLGSIAIAAPASPASAFAPSGDPGPSSSRTAPASQHSGGDMEKGMVIECHASDVEREVFVTVYENSRYTNYAQVVVGDPDDGGVGGSVDTQDDLVHARRARVEVPLGDLTAVVKGKVVRTGDKERVFEEMDDAGNHIVTTGWHRDLETRLVLKYDGERIPLTCDNAFAYHLHVTKTPIGA